MLFDGRRRNEGLKKGLLNLGPPSFLQPFFDGPQKARFSVRSVPPCEKPQKLLFTPF